MKTKRLVLAAVCAGMLTAGCTIQVVAPTSTTQRPAASEITTSTLNARQRAGLTKVADVLGEV